VPQWCLWEPSGSVTHCIVAFQRLSNATVFIARTPSQKLLLLILFRFRGAPLLPLRVHCTEVSSLQIAYVFLREASVQQFPISPQQIRGSGCPFSSCILHSIPLSCGPTLFSGGQGYWLEIKRSRVRFPALPDFLGTSGSGTGSTQPREYNWGATWKKK
jgi:hypothetical protein